VRGRQKIASTRRGDQRVPIGIRREKRRKVIDESQGYSDSIKKCHALGMKLKDGKHSSIGKGE